MAFSEPKSTKLCGYKLTYLVISFWIAIGGQIKKKFTEIPIRLNRNNISLNILFVHETMQVTIN